MADWRGFASRIPCHHVLPFQLKPPAKLIDVSSRQIRFSLPSLFLERMFERSLLRELSQVAAGIFIVLLAIMVVIRGVNLLGAAAGGGVPSGDIGALLGFTVMGFVPWLLPFSAYMTVLWALSRAYRDHEMDVWMSAGLSLYAWIKPVLVFAVPLALLGAVLSLGLTPWANQKSREYRDALLSREDVSAVSPGIFKESSNSDQVYYVENFSSENGSARNIFIKSSKEGREHITVANDGFLLTQPSGERWIVLRNGRRYDGTFGTASFRVTEFKESRIRVEEGSTRLTHHDTRTIDSRVLWRSTDPVYQSELAWRLAVPISTILLALAAVPLAFFNPRVGRSFNTIIAILIFSIYFNVLTIADSWIAEGKISVAVNLWPVYGGMLAFTALLFWWRQRPRF